MEEKHITVLGSTGSVGSQALDVADFHHYFVDAVALGSNIRLGEEQIRRFRPQYAAVGEEAAAKALKTAVKDTDTKVMCGTDGILEMMERVHSDVCIHAIGGFAGLRPVFAAIRHFPRIGLANKESLVAAGSLVMKAAAESGCEIIPVDSEHSAIFQSLNGEKKTQIDKILLTASGGPFRGKDKAFLKHVQLEDALKHPNWSMGHKITIDSASMVNKGLEVMEAKWLFDVELDQIQVVIQPQSIIHSMVQYKDGAVIAQLGTPDMKLPIQYALFYPDREYLAGERLDFWSLSQISFEKPDMENFEGLPLAFAAAKAGGSMPTVFNAANERAVSKFLNRKIGFLDIYEIIKTCMDAHKVIEAPTVEQILQCEQETYEMIESRW